MEISCSDMPIQFFSLSPHRKFESAVCITDDQREGVVRVGRMLLHSKYPRYAVDGHQALYARPPLIYVAATAHTTLPLHLANAVSGSFLSCISS